MPLLFSPSCLQGTSESKKKKAVSVSTLSMDKEITSAGLQLKCYQKPLNNKNACSLYTSYLLAFPRASKPLMITHLASTNLLIIQFTWIIKFPSIINLSFLKVSKTHFSFTETLTDPCSACLPPALFCRSAV